MTSVAFDEPGVFSVEDCKKRSRDESIEDEAVLNQLYSSFVVSLFPGIGQGYVGALERPTGTPRRSKQLTYVLTVRFKILLLLLAVVFLMMFMNASMGMSIICMVERSTGFVPDNATNVTTEGEPDCRTVAWSPATQGIVLSAFSWGQLLSPAAGLFADKINIKLLISLGACGTAFLTALIPFVAPASASVVVILRALAGACDAFVQPSVNRFICTWFPTKERNAALSIVTAGFQLAVLVAFPLAGFFCTQCQVYGGWSLTFWTPLILTAIWFVIWSIWSHQNPLLHHRIGRAERSYIRRSTDMSLESTELTIGTPWRKFWTCKALYANVAAILCHEVPVAVIFTFLPQYMRDVLCFDIKQNGLLSGMPALSLMIFKILSAQASGYIVHRFGYGRTVVVKAFNFVASALLGVLLIIVTYIPSFHRNLAVATFIGAAAAAGLHTAGCVSTPVSIAPQFAGTIAGMCFFAIGVGLLLMPILVKAVVVSGNLSEWRAVMLSAGAIALLPMTFFTMWGSADIQPWARLHQQQSIRIVKSMRRVSATSPRNHGPMPS